MKKSIVLSGREIHYELQRKKVKNINLRIKADGSIFVSAHRLVPQSAIDAFLRDKAEFVLHALEKRENAVSPCYKEGSTVPLLGKNYVLHLVPAGRNRAELKDESVILYIREGSEPSKVLDGIYRKEAERHVPPLCESLCTQMGRAMPEIKYRRMKSRWGSCTPMKGQICINTRLLTASIDCVEFVIAHELCHFLQPNHSAEFYAELTALMPDWKERKKALRAYGSFLQ